jgi:PAS domain S-box-containing protein
LSGQTAWDNASEIGPASLFAAVEQAADGIVITDKSGKIQFVNPAFTAMTGYAREEAVGRNPRMLKSDRQSPAFYEKLWSTILSGHVWQGEVCNLRKDGSLYDEEMRIAPILGADGSISGFIATKHDVTEKRKREEAQAFLAAIVEGCEEAIIAVSPAGLILTWNNAAEALFALPAQQAIGRKMSSFVPPDRLPQLARFIEQVSQGKTLSNYEGQCLRAHGERVHVTVTGFPVRDAAGQIVAGIAILRDNTERKKAEQRLIESEARFRSMADSCPSMMWVADADANLEFVNRVGRDFLGISTDHLAKSDWMATIHPDDVAGFETSYTSAVQERGRFRMEHRVRRADGQWRLVGATSHPRLAPDGSYMGHVGLSADITERRIEEQAHAFQHSLIRTIQEVALDGILVADNEGTVLSYNKKLLDVWRIRDSELPRPLRAMSATGPVQPLMAAILKRVKYAEFLLQRIRDLYTNPGVTDQCELELKDGRTLELYSTSLRDEQGKYLARAWFYRDITERKQAQQALEVSEEKFRQLAENVREVFWIKDAGREEFFYVSPAYERIWERSCASIYQDPLSRLEAIHPEDRQRSSSIFKRQMQGETIDSEYRILTPGGQEKWVSDRAFPIRNADGVLIRLVGIVEDITERKHYEAEILRAGDEAEEANRRLSFQNTTLENERSFLRAFLDNIPDLMYVKDTDCRFIVANSALAQLVDARNPAELIGKSDFDFFPPEMAKAFYEDEQNVIRSGRPLVDREESVSRTKTDKIRYALTTKVPLFDSQGFLTGIAGIGRDITERKLAEEALRESNCQLQEATDRANELALKAGAANEAKSRFLANMSHEIRTPMNGVIGMNQLLLETNLTAQQRRFVEVAQSSGRALLALIDNILDLSKIEAGKIVLENRSFDLHRTVEEVVEILRVQAGAKGLHIDAQVSSKIPLTLRGDALRLRQVLTNLAANAIKFTERGAITLEAELVSLNQGAAMLRFTVTDSGIGITEEQIGNLFTPFVQADASTTRKYGGTGLGLAISKQIVERMGGSIGVNRRDEQGSVFWFTAAFKVGPAAEDPTARHPRKVARAAHEASARTPGLANGHGEKILVVEDNFTNREVILAQLKMMGYVASAVGNGAEALEAVGRGKFDLVLMDCEMPVMDGYEATRRIRQSIQQHIPIVALTANAMTQDREQCLQAGMDDYLAKPVELQQLATALDKWIQAAKAAVPQPSLAEPAPKPTIPVFDEVSLLRRMMGEKRLVRIVLHGFIEDAPAQLEQMRIRLEANDGPGTRLQAHTLKGSAATVAAEALHAASLAMEIAARAGELDKCRELLPGVCDEFERFKTALQREGWL